MTNFEKLRGARMDGQTRLHTLPTYIEIMQDNNIATVHTFEDFSKAQDYLDALAFGEPEPPITHGHITIQVQL